MIRSWLKDRIGLLYCKFLYERKSIKWKNFNFYKSLLPPNQLCFDVGANVGGRTKAFLETGAKIVCIEPQSLFFEYLKKQFKLNSNVFLEKLAVGEKSEILNIQISSIFPTLSTLAGEQWIKNTINSSDFPLKINYDKEERVRVETLDYLIDKYGLPYFCKIDVEGFEYQVLQGLSQSIPLLSFEFFNYDMNNTKLCLDRLLDLEYGKFNWSIGEHQQFEMPAWSNSVDLLKDIQLKNSRKFSGDIYAKLK